jgi:(E)-4-hydroxy-3-methylbut-2-enyl-diphosphate synthase
MERRKTRQVSVGKVKIGGDAPIVVQSMTNTHTDDAAATLKQIKELAAAGCEIIRCAVPDQAAAEGLKEIVAKSPIPVVADIHFDYQLALAAIKAGVQALRLNPGNIGGDDRVEAVVNAAKPLNIPIRIGVNAGSLPKTFWKSMAMLHQKPWWKQPGAISIS